MSIARNISVWTLLFASNVSRNLFIFFLEAQTQRKCWRQKIWIKITFVFPYLHIAVLTTIQKKETNQTLALAKNGGYTKYVTGLLSFGDTLVHSGSSVHCFFIAFMCSLNFRFDWYTCPIFYKHWFRPYRAEYNFWKHQRILVPIPKHNTSTVSCSVYRLNSFFFAST